MIWRSAIVGAYIALAIAVGIAFDGRGLAILLLLYLVAGAWLAFVLAWGPFARRVGRGHVERLRGPRSSR